MENIRNYLRDQVSKRYPTTVVEFNFRYFRYEREYAIIGIYAHRSRIVLSCRPLSREIIKTPDIRLNDYRISQFFRNIRAMREKFSRLQ